MRCDVRGYVICISNNVEYRDKDQRSSVGNFSALCNAVEKMYYTNFRAIHTLRYFPTLFEDVHSDITKDKQKKNSICLISIYRLKIRIIFSRDIEKTLEHIIHITWL